MKSFLKDKLNIILVILLLLLIGATAYFVNKLMQPEPITVIDFSQLNEEEIKEWLAKENISEDKYTIAYEYSDEVEEGHLISQDPEAGEALGDMLKLVISKGSDPEKEIELPTIDGNTTKADLEKWFKENGFTNITYQYTLDNEKDKDIVLSMDKSGKVKRSEAINVVVSAGNGEDAIVTVPDFTALSLEEAKAWAENNMMNLNIDYINSEQEADTILSQDVEKGSELKAGSDITLTVSAGEAITLPDFYGYTLAQARTWGSENGVNITSVDIYSDTTSAGYIAYSDPKGNTAVSKGSTVKVYVSLGEDPSSKTVYVDTNQLGKTEKEFLQYIDSLGLKHQKENVEYYSTTLPAGTIFSYNDGNLTSDTVITYALSRGPYELDLSQIEGKSKSNAQTYVDNINSLNGHLNLSTSEEYSSKYASGTLYDCSSTKVDITYNVSCKVSLGEKVESTPTPTPTPTSTQETSNSTSYVPSLDNLRAVVSNKCGTNNYSCSVETVQDYFKDFGSVSVNGVSSSFGVGVVTKITVDGSVVEAGNYSTSSKIVVNICNSQSN